MRLPLSLVAVLAALALAEPAVALETVIVERPALGPAVLASQADVVVLGRVVEVEKDTVDVAPHPGAAADQRVAYKVAVVKSEEALVGGAGLTQFRVGFPDGAAAPGAGRAVPAGRLVLQEESYIGGGIPVAVVAEQKGCFFLQRHPTADFYVLANNGTGRPLDRKDDGFDTHLKDVRKVAKVIREPVSALKAADPKDRYGAALLILQRYQRKPGGRPTDREPIPAEENRLIVRLMTELPWMPDPTKPVPEDGVIPHRRSLWNLINPADLGYKPTQRPGNPAADADRRLGEDTAAFLKDNADKIKLKGYVR